MINRKLFNNVLKNRNKIPSEMWSKAENGKIVLWLLDREDGTAGSYETSQERLGITIEGDIVYGFSSGCSCWSGWGDSDYEPTITYKQFIMQKQDLFQKDWDNEVNDRLVELNKLIINKQ